MVMVYKEKSNHVNKDGGQKIMKDQDKYLKITTNQVSKKEVIPGRNTYLIEYRTYTVDGVTNPVDILTVQCGRKVLAINKKPKVTIPLSIVTEITVGSHSTDRKRVDNQLKFEAYRSIYE